MAEKIFKVPFECKNLLSHFKAMKEAACEELRENGISDEPAQVSLNELQAVCDQSLGGSLVRYVLELQKCFHMNEVELIEYDQLVGQKQNFADSLDDDDTDLWSEDGADDEADDSWGEDDDLDMFDGDLASGPLELD
ncbi:MAG: hypothetical protein HQM13_13895 [SAR324 cluster bacterium]|nr:hypothetical protein [SAR324 cluster bacterium]